MSKLTKKAIFNAFLELLRQKPLDKITVKEIIEEADVNRNTFYYHFEDIYALVDAIFWDEAEKFQQETPEESNFCEEYTRAAGFLLRNRQAVIHIYQSKRREVLIRYLDTAAKHFVSGFVEKAAQGTGLSASGTHFITAFYSHAIVGGTLHWIEEGMSEYSDELIRTISRSFDATIDDMIRSYMEDHPD